MTKTILLASTLLALAAAPGTAATDAPSSADVFGILQASDGDVGVFLAGDVDLQLLDGLTQALAASSAQKVRFGISDTTPDRVAAIALIESKGSGRSGWMVCEEWMTSLAGQPDRVAPEIVDRFGSSLVLIDNGSNDRDRFGPAMGDDPIDGRAENPILSGLFDANTPWGLVTDDDAYRGAWSYLDGVPREMEMGGC